MQSIQTRINKPLQLCFLTFCLFIASCNFTTSSTYTTLSAGEFYKSFNNDNNSVVIDIRTTKEFSEYRIEKSINIPYAKDFIENEIFKDSTKSFFIYSRAGEISAKACEQLHENGIKNIYNLSDGIIGWRSINFGVVID